ncbi:hypothetical protein [Campylobacter ureolyticus]|uniref:Uncharacterized protein n=1 Tax=Campylobacter ureolyticus TaxID=827 RepID=A0AAE7JQ59_9BACT|nr:hypothetical protein [Campylobacter ureolyticus]MCR8685628.1 hypothetical protein [Campylobacter ureolyticus]QKF85092.1 hypothetical protein CURT_1664 [Campylobacter ureolyticus]QQY36427.1 hypothetical protein I6I59_04165 [Campylobacter ureolyticus]SUX25611.1 Uncharacterised protein [Campylobacter ureolyticus]
MKNFYRNLTYDKRYNARSCLDTKWQFIHAWCLFCSVKNKDNKNSKKYFTPILAPTADDRLKRLKNTDTLYRL